MRTNALKCLGLWDFVIARHIKVVDNCKDEIVEFLNKLTRDDLFSRETWNLYADRDDDALWFSLPDVAASVILNGRVPKIVDAFRLEPSGVLPNLHTVKLRGNIEIDP